MRRTVEIKEKLIREVMEITGAPNEVEVIEGILEAYLARHRARRVFGAPCARKSMFDLVGKIRLRDDYDPRRPKFPRYDAD